METFLVIRLIQIVMLGTIALFFSIVVFDNLIDFNSNWLFVQHVLSMDTTFRSSVLMGRAITNPGIQKIFYYGIIFWEFLTAVLCCIGVVTLSRQVNQNLSTYNQAKKIAYLGLTFGFLLYMLAFIIVGGEWFSMWQSSTWNGQMKAGLFIMLIMFVLIFLAVGNLSEKDV